MHVTNTHLGALRWLCLRCACACGRGVELEGSVASSHVTSLRVLPSVRISLLWLQLVCAPRLCSAGPLHHRAERKKPAARSSARISLTGNHPTDRRSSDKSVRKDAELRWRECCLLCGRTGAPLRLRETGALRRRPPRSLPLLPLQPSVYSSQRETA